MKEKYYISTVELTELLHQMKNRMMPEIKRLIKQDVKIQVYGIPKGGSILAGYFCSLYPDFFSHCLDIELADIIIDDLIDSGSTIKGIYNKYPIVSDVPFFCLFDQRESNPYNDKWIVFPWELEENNDIDDNFIRLLQYYNKSLDKLEIFKSKVNDIMSQL